MRYGKSKFSRPVSRRPKVRMFTEAEQRTFDAAPATITGRHMKGDVVTDGKQCWKIVSRGVRYHEDVTDAIYAVQPARGPKEWAATVTLRQTIETILRTGAHTPNSRAAKHDGTDIDIPAGAVKVLEWRDGEPNSLASYPILTLHEGDLLVAVRPNYDDSPLVAWVRDKKLAQAVIKAAAIAPKPHHLARVNIRMRPAKPPATE